MCLPLHSVPCSTHDTTGADGAGSDWWLCPSVWMSEEGEEAEDSEDGSYYDAAAAGAATMAEPATARPSEAELTSLCAERAGLAQAIDQDSTAYPPTLPPPPPSPSPPAMRPMQPPRPPPPLARPPPSTSAFGKSPEEPAAEEGEPRVGMLAAPRHPPGMPPVAAEQADDDFDGDAEVGDASRAPDDAEERPERPGSTPAPPATHDDGDGGGALLALLLVCLLGCAAVQLLSKRGAALDRRGAASGRGLSPADGDGSFGGGSVALQDLRAQRAAEYAGTRSTPAPATPRAVAQGAQALAAVVTGATASVATKGSKGEKASLTARTNEDDEDDESWL